MPKYRELLMKALLEWSEHKHRELNEIYKDCGVWREYTLLLTAGEEEWLLDQEMRLMEEKFGYT